MNTILIHTRYNLVEAQTCAPNSINMSRRSIFQHRFQRSNVFNATEPPTFPQGMRVASGSSWEVGIQQQRKGTLEMLQTVCLQTWGLWWFKVTFLGWLSDPLRGLSDLQWGDKNGHFESPRWYSFFSGENYRKFATWFWLILGGPHILRGNQTEFLENPVNRDRIMKSLKSPWFIGCLLLAQ